MDHSVIFISDIQMVPHACKVVSKTLHAYELCEMSHSWWCEWCAYVDICGDVYMTLCLFLGDTSKIMIMVMKWEWWEQS